MKCGLSSLVLHLRGHRVLIALGLVCCVVASPLGLHAQTGVYTLSSGTSTQASLSETSSTADQSGIYVYGGGALTVTGNVTANKTGTASDTTASSKYGLNVGVLAGNSSTIGTITIQGTGSSITTNAVGGNGLFATGSGSSITMNGGTISTTLGTSHGVDATYGGAITLTNVNITTQADGASAALSTLEEAGQPYVLAVTGQQCVWLGLWPAARQDRQDPGARQRLGGDQCGRGHQGTARF